MRKPIKPALDASGLSGISYWVDKLELSFTICPIVI